MRKSLILLVAMAGSLALTFFLSRHQDSDPTVWITVGIMMLVIYIPFGIPPVGSYIYDRPRTIFWVGFSLIAGGLAAMFGLFFTSAYFGIPSSVTGTDSISVAIMWVMMAGIVLTILPRSIAALKRAEKTEVAPKLSLPAHNEFNGVREAWIAVLTVLRNWAPFARLVGPWIVLLWAAPFVGLHIAAYSNGLAPSVFAMPVGKLDAATELFGERLPLLLASAFALPMALVGWHRYILSDTIPTFGSGAPFGIAIRYLWRLWMISVLFSVLPRLVASNAPDLAGLFGISDKLFVEEFLFWGVLFGIVYMGSSFALVLPAVAVGNRDFLGTDSIRIAKLLGNSFRVGFVLSFLPFALAWWGAVELLDRFGIIGFSLANHSLWLVPTALIFLAFASCATYLSRIYAARLAADH